MKGIITEIHRTSIVDGPGIRTSVFMKGCPLRCIWCHNPETQHMDIQSGYGKEVELETVLRECEKDRMFYEESGGGVTVSGGEPLMQHEFTLELLSRLKKSGIHTTLDTSGYAHQSVVKKSMGVTDLYLFDYKISDPELHVQFTKKSQDPILENFDFLMRSGAKVILRCPLVPNVNDSDAHLASIVEMESRYPSLEQIDILPWHTMGRVKYRKLGLKLDHRLPKENTPKSVIERYRTYFKDRKCEKVVVKD